MKRSEVNEVIALLFFIFGEVVKNESLSTGATLLGFCYIVAALVCMLREP